ncbi:hypothetical protein CJD36_020260 [Flavipsychrobacter stenotrophus]|uniref:Alginate export domain-containing protein n=1 Tax=Flavipsychrobacter stenotrophus TaxID=2077091 RepID=A0A2S7SR74_9BACT|nr:alginate export family protein [Flavipsychrobacter stenotrophus]PQJ09131.1 hypothetical protein CJD36_020260 [Flavipsychrobacter stenotrophus]
MRYSIFPFILWLMVSASNSYSQINILRYNDNFTYLKADSVNKKGIDKIKYITLTKGTNISFGGDFREQLQYYKNSNFGDAKSSHTNTFQLWHRLMIHSNLELGKKTRLFAQLGSTFRFFNPDPLTPEIDENRLSLHQAFIDYNYNKNWLFRIGRQEVTYGNNRVVTFREGPNTRQTFDAAIAKYHTEKRRLDILVMSPVISEPGLFDDKSSGEVIIGVYGTEVARKNLPGLDYYILSYTGNRRKYNFTPGNEVRQIYGFRIFSKNKSFNYEFEGTYQSGKFNNLRINAYSISADLNYALVTKKLTLGVAANYASGDKNKNDKELNTYNFLFSKPQYGLAAPIGATNIANINPYVTVTPFKEVHIDAGAFFMWRQSAQDGTYSPLAKEVRPGPALLFSSTNKRIGTLLNLESTFVITKNFSFGVDDAYFIAGNYPKGTGKGKDIFYSALKATIKF